MASVAGAGGVSTPTLSVNSGGHASGLTLAHATSGPTGLDTVAAAPQGSSALAGQLTSSAQTVVSQSGGNTVLHLADGSTITLLGTPHVDASFFH